MTSSAPVRRRTLPRDPSAAALARRAVEAEAADLSDAQLDVARLLVSELVTNAVRHAGAGPDRPLHVQLLRGPRWVVVAVADEGPGFTWHPTSRPAANESGGWGLFLVEQIADHWGVECTTSGTCVWFELAYEE
jgi:anti-sigma regulatory factor (Ser/Thr protein kinase)